MTEQEMPPDPWGAPEEMINMMRGMYKLHCAAMAAGFQEHTAIQFVVGVFTSLMHSAQPPSPEAADAAPEA